MAKVTEDLEMAKLTGLLKIHPQTLKEAGMLLKATIVKTFKGNLVMKARLHRTEQ